MLVTHYNRFSEFIKQMIKFSEHCLRLLYWQHSQAHRSWSLTTVPKLVTLNDLERRSKTLPSTTLLIWHRALRCWREGGVFNCGRLMVWPPSLSYIIYMIYDKNNLIWLKLTIPLHLQHAPSHFSCIITLLRGFTFSTCITCKTPLLPSQFRLSVLCHEIVSDQETRAISAVAELLLLYVRLYHRFWDIAVCWSHFCLWHGVPLF